MKIEFYSFTIVKEAQRAATLSEKITNLLRSIGLNIKPMVTVVQPSPKGNPDHIYLALKDEETERTAIGRYDSVTKQRHGYRQNIRVEFPAGAYLFLDSERQDFQIVGDEVRTSRYDMLVAKISYGPVIKETGILTDGRWVVRGDPEETSLMWEQVPQGVSEMMAAAAG